MSCLAYVDDTTWVAHFCEDLQEILDLAREFYLINNSRINATKSQLLVINGSQKDRELGMKASIDSMQVWPESQTTLIKFLDIYIAEKKQIDGVVHIVKEESH